MNLNESITALKITDDNKFLLIGTDNAHIDV